MFTTDDPTDFSDILEGIPQTITAEMNRKLIRPVSEQEISHAVNSMHPNKSPGPDGMSPIFFQKFWHVIRKDVIIKTIILCLIYGLINYLIGFLPRGIFSSLIRPKYMEI